MTLRKRDGSAPAPQRLWLASVWVLVLVYLVAGVFGRSLWKADEPYSFGIVWEMLADHQWLVPHVAGQPFVEKPPLVYWVAAGFAEALPDLHPDESARLAVLLFSAIGVGALYAAARRLYREAVGWIGVPGRGAGASSGGATEPGAHVYATLGLLLMVGTLGFAEHIHKLTADIGQLAGAILGLCGIIYVGTSRDGHAESSADRRSGIAGGVMLGTGAGIAFLSKGLLVPGLLATTCTLLLVLPDYRSRTARLAFAVAALTAVPWVVVWPVMFHAASPDLFREWLWGNNIGRFVGSTLLGGNHRSLANKLESIVAAGLPTVLLLPLVGWRISRSTAGRGRGGAWKAIRSAPGHASLAVFLAISVTVLAVSASMRDIYVLPLLPAIVLLGLPALLPGPGGSSSAARRFAVAAFAGAAAILVVVWVELATTGNLAGAPGLARVVARTLPLPFRLGISWPAILVVVGTVAAWAYVVRRDILRSATVAWSAGFAMTWIVAATLLLPWIDAARSYQGVFREIAPQLLSARDCVATLNMGESEVSMLEYVTGIEATREYLGHSGSGLRADPNPAARDCDWLLALSNRESRRVHPDPDRWRPVRTISRPADSNERITLYRAAPRGNVY